MPDPLEIDVKSVKAMLDRQDEFLLLDVRNDDEYQFAHIDAAKLLPMPQIAQRVGELADHKDRPIVVHCHHGGRSLRVTHWLLGQGFSNVRNMTGGIDAWAQEVDTGMPRY